MALDPDRPRRRRRALADRRLPSLRPTPRLLSRHSSGRPRHKQLSLGLLLITTMPDDRCQPIRIHARSRLRNDLSCNRRRCIRSLCCALEGNLSARAVVSSALRRRKRLIRSVMSSACSGVHHAFDVLCIAGNCLYRPSNPWSLQWQQQSLLTTWTRFSESWTD